MVQLVAKSYYDTEIFEAGAFVQAEYSAPLTATLAHHLVFVSILDHGGYPVGECGGQIVQRAI